MDQYRDFADDRLIDGCVYCGGPGDTRDHVPSKVFLDSPRPENLPVVPACRTCNNGFSSDEEYVACLIESVISGSTDPEMIRRPSIAKILKRSPALRSKIDQSISSREGTTYFSPEYDRIKTVVLKLARGHAAFELSQSCQDEPTHFWFCPIALLSSDEREKFEECDFPVLLGEIGSRAMQRLLIAQFSLSSGQDSTSLQLFINDWIEVQDGRYRYIAIHSESEIQVKFVIGEYLACEVMWES